MPSTVQMSRERKHQYFSNSNPISVPVPSIHKYFELFRFPLRKILDIFQLLTAFSSPLIFDARTHYGLALKHSRVIINRDFRRCKHVPHQSWLNSANLQFCNSKPFPSFRLIQYLVPLAACVFRNLPCSASEEHQTSYALRQTYFKIHWYIPKL